MLQRLKELLRLPSPLADDSAYASRTVEVLASAEMALLLLPVAQDWAQKHFSGVGAMAVQEVALLAVLWLNRQKRIAAAGRLLCVSNWAMLSALCWLSGHGLGATAVFAFPALLMAAALLLDFGFFLAITGLVGASVAFLSATGDGMTADGATLRATGFPDFAAILLFTAVTAGFFAREIRRALDRAQRNEAALAASKAELETHAGTLKTSEQKLRTAMELAVEGIAHSDPDGRIVQANSRVAEITGYSSAELVGRMFTHFFSPDELARVPVPWDQLNRGEVVTTERLLTRKDGSTTLVEMTSRRLPDHSLQSFVRDISGRQEREEQVRQNQRLEALGKLAGGVAHDFNNLLTVMHAALDAVEGDPALSPSLKLPVLDLRSAAARAGDLTRQLLTFARRQPLARKPMDLRDAVEQNARMLRRLLGPQVELVVECVAEVCPVLADPGALTHVVLNLAVNGRDAMPNGGRLVLAVRTEEHATPPRAGGRDLPPGRYACLRVADSGGGMDEATRSRIFEPFFTTKGLGKGTGLGLSVSLGIVQQHDGWIEVDSAAGRGTEFRVYLPIHVGPEPLPEPAAPAMAARPAVTGTETVLVVEDEEPVRRLTVGALQWCGFTVIEAADGREALDAWERHGAVIALLLTDVAMPGGLSGIDVVKACREQRPGLPVIVTSGYSQDTVAFGDEFWDDIRFLPKPFTMAALSLAVRQTIDRAT